MLKKSSSTNNKQDYFQNVIDYITFYTRKLVKTNTLGENIFNAHFLFSATPIKITRFPNQPAKKGKYRVLSRVILMGRRVILMGQQGNFDGSAG